MFDNLDSYSVSLIAWLVMGGGAAVWLLVDPRWLDQPLDARRVSALLTTAIGICAALIVVFAPLYTETRVESNPSGEPVQTTSRVSLWEQGLPTEFALMLAVFAGVMIIIGRCAVPHGREHSRQAQLLLWGSAFALLVAAGITILTVGLILIPVTLLAFVTAIHATRARSSDDSKPDQEYQHSGI